MIKRDKSYITPNGATQIKAGDDMLIMANTETEIEKIQEVLDIT